MMTAKEVRELRMKLQLNQSAFWSRVGIGQSGGSRYESGSTEISAPVQKLLAIAYGTQVQANRLVATLRGK